MSAEIPPVNGRTRLPRNVWIAGFVSLFNDASSEMIYPLLPVFLTSVLGASRTSLGFVEGFAEATASLVKVASGVWSDRLRKRRLPMFLGYGFSLAARPLIAMAGSWGTVFWARFLDRVGKGVRTAPRDAVIADSTPAAIRGRAYGVHRALDTAGAAIGPGVAALLLAGFSWEIRSVLWLSIVPGIVALVFIAFIREEAPAAGGASRPSLAGAFRIGGPFRDFLVVTALFTLGNSSDTFLLLKAKSEGLSIGEVTGVYLLFNLFYAAVAGPIGAFSDRWGRRRVTGLSFFYYGAVYLGFALAGGAWQVALLFVLYGPFQAVEEGVKKAYLSELIPSGLMASGMGVYHAVKGIMLLPASLLTGYLWDRLGDTAAFSACAGLAALSGALFSLLVVLRRRGGSP
jgi:MFS family permease